MARLVVMPVGLSILRNLKTSVGVELTLGQEAVQLRPLLNGPSQNLHRLSAELSVLTKVKVSPQDKVAFLATDTDAGECAANANAVVAQHLFHVEAEVERIKGLVLDNAEIFVKKGLRNFFHALDRLVGWAWDAGYEPLMEVAGGIKPVIPYTAIYGMLRQIPLVYVFERTQALITLPPLPLDFDWPALERALRALREIEDRIAIPRHELKHLLGEDFPRLAGLFEEMEGKMTLSAFGHMLLEALARSQETPVMLSPNAAKKLEQLSGLARQQVEILLDRVRNPIWRSAKWHPFSGTDLDVWKPGAVSLRLAGWVQGELVHVAEIYTEHDHYERDLPSRSRSQYESQRFLPYVPEPVRIEREALEEAKGDDLLALAIQRRKEAEQDKEQALQLASQYEREMNHWKDLHRQLERQLHELRRREAERSSWGLWRRLRWAIFGS